MVSKPFQVAFLLLLGAVIAGCSSGSGGGGAQSATSTADGFNIFDDPQAQTTMSQDDVALTQTIGKTEIEDGRSDVSCDDRYVGDGTALWEITGSTGRHVADKCAAYGAGDPLIDLASGSLLTIEGFAVLDPTHLILILGQNGWRENPPDLQWPFSGILDVCPIFDEGDATIAFAYSADSCVRWSPGQYIDHSDGSGRPLIGFFIRWVAFGGHHTLDDPYIFQRQVHPRAIHFPGAADVCRAYPGLATGWNLYQQVECSLDGGTTSTPMEIDGVTGGTVGDHVYYTTDGVPYCRVKDLEKFEITDYYSWNEDLNQGCLIANSPHDPHGDGSYAGPQNTESGGSNGGNGGTDNPPTNNGTPDAPQCGPNDVAEDFRDGFWWGWNGSEGCWSHDKQSGNGGNGGTDNPPTNNGTPDAPQCGPNDVAEDFRDGFWWGWNGSEGCWSHDKQSGNGGNGGTDNPPTNNGTPDAPQCGPNDVAEDFRDGFWWGWNGSEGCWSHDKQSGNGGNGGTDNPPTNNGTPDAPQCGPNDVAEDFRDGFWWGWNGSEGCWSHDKQSGNGGNGGTDNPPTNNGTPDAPQCGPNDVAEDFRDGFWWGWNGSEGCWSHDKQSGNGGNGGTDNPPTNNGTPDAPQCGPNDVAEDFRDGFWWGWNGSEGCWSHDKQSGNGGNGGTDNPPTNNGTPDAPQCGPNDVAEDFRDGFWWGWNGSEGCWSHDKQSGNGGNGGTDNPPTNNGTPDAPQCGPNDVAEDFRDGFWWGWNGSEGCWSHDKQSGNGGNGGTDNPPTNNGTPDAPQCGPNDVAEDFRDGFWWGWNGSEGCWSHDKQSGNGGNGGTDNPPTNNGTPDAPQCGPNDVAEDFRDGFWWGWNGSEGCWSHDKQSGNGGNGGTDNPPTNNGTPDAPQCGPNDVAEDFRDGFWWGWNGSEGCWSHDKQSGNGGNGGLSHDEAKLCVNKDFPSGTFIEDRDGDGWSDNVEPGCKLPEGESSMTIASVGDAANDDYFLVTSLRLVG